MWNGDVPWFSAKDVKHDRLADSTDHISEQALASTSLKRLPAGTIVIVVRGMILAHTVPIAILEVEGAINQDLKALLPKMEVDAVYLAAMLRAQHASILSQVSTAAHGTKKIEMRVLEGLLIPLPSLPEQRRIAAILDHADTLRAQRRAVVAQVDSFKQTMFRELADLAAWDLTLGSLADIQIGPFGSLLHKQDYVAGGVPVINPMHIRDGQLIPDLTFAVSEQKAATLSPYRLREGDVVLGRRGEMGRAGIAGANHVGMLCGTGSLILRPRGVNSRFLHAVVTSLRMKAYLQSSALGVTLANLNASIVKSAPAPRVDPGEQARYDAAVTAVQTLMTTAQLATAAADELFASLQSRAFVGGL